MFFTIEFISSNLGSENAGKFLKVANDGSASFGNPTCDPQDIADAVDDYMAEHPISGESLAEHSVEPNKIEYVDHNVSTNLWDFDASNAEGHAFTRSVNLEDCSQNWQAYLGSGGIWTSTNGYANGTSDDPSFWDGVLFGYCQTDYIEIPENGLMKLNFPVRNYVTFKSKSVNEYTYQFAKGQRACASSEYVGTYASAIAAGTVIDFTSAVANGAKYVRFGAYEGLGYICATKMLAKNPLAYATDSVHELAEPEPYYNDYRMSNMITSDYADSVSAAKLVEAKGYADGKLVEAKAYSDDKLVEAKAYTDDHAISDENAQFLTDIKDVDEFHSNNQIDPDSLYTVLPNGDPVDFNNYIGRYLGWAQTFDEDQTQPGAYTPDNKPMDRAPYNTSVNNETVAKGTYGATTPTSAGANYGIIGSYNIENVGIAGHWVSFNIPLRFFASTTGPIALDSSFKNCTTNGSFISWMGANGNGLRANVWHYIPADLDTSVYKYIHLSVNGSTYQENLPQFGGNSYFCMRIADGSLTRQEVEALDITVLPNDRYSSVRNVYLDATEIRDGGIPSSKFDMGAIASTVPDYIGTHEFPAEKLEICETIRSTNVVNPASLWQCPDGWFANGNSWSDNFATYFVSDFIPVPEGGVFKMNGRARTIAWYASNATTDYSYNPVEPQAIGADYISYKSTDTAAGDEITAPAGAKYFRASFYVSDKGYLATSLYVAKSDEYDPDHSQWFEPYEMIKADYIPESPAPTPTGDSYELINIANSDKIMFIGDSYTEASHSIENKAYPAKLSMFSDYEIENMAMSGDIYFGQLDKIRTNYTRWGTSFLKCNPKYAIMTCWTNDIKTLDVNQYAEGLRSCCKQVISLGAQPLISTEYHSSGATAQVPTINDQIARELGCPNWNYSKLVRLIRGSDYAPFWGGSHPGPRTNAIESDNMEKYLNTLERPRKSLKFFRLRDSMDFDPTGDMTNLVYWNNEERAEKFKEIHVSHSVIQDPTMVDNITNASTTGQTSEYAIMQDGGNCTFHRAGIMDVVIPGTYKSTSDVYVKLGTNAQNFKFYVLDSLAGSYTRPVYMIRVDLKSSLCTNVPAIDDVYDMTPALPNIAQSRLTVKQIVYGIGDAGADMTLFCYLNGSPVSYSQSVTDSPGTLTKVSGQGDDTVAYTYRAKSYNTDNIDDIIIGGWTEIEPVEDHGMLIFTLDNTKLKQYIHRDKLSFLFTNADSEGTLTDFTIDHPQVYWSGKDDKMYERKQLNFISNYDNSNTELLDHTTFGTAGTLDPNFNVTPISVYDSCYPVDCTSAAVINDSTKITITLSAAACTALKCTGNTNPANLTTTEAILEVWARYFPDLYTDGSGNQITGDSYDYAKLYVDMVATSEKYTATLSERVNTHWKIVQFPLHVSGMWTDPKIRLWSNKDLQIAKISLKLQEVTRTHS